MTDAIIVAAITAAAAIVGQLIIANKQSHDLYTKLDKQFSMQDKDLEGKIELLKETVEIKLENLTAEVKKHNNFAQRMPVVEEQMKVANHRIADLERKVS